MGVCSSFEMCSPPQCKGAQDTTFSELCGGGRSVVTLLRRPRPLGRGGMGGSSLSPGNLHAVRAVGSQGAGAERRAGFGHPRPAGHGSRDGRWSPGGRQHSVARSEVR